MIEAWIPITLFAAFTLATAVIMQTVIMGAYMLLREPRQLIAAFKHWRDALPVGVISAVVLHLALPLSTVYSDWVNRVECPPQYFCKAEH